MEAQPQMETSRSGMGLAPRALIMPARRGQKKFFPQASAESLGSKADSVEPKAKKPGSLSDH
jgi:hypothetical protein